MSGRWTKAEALAWVEAERRDRRPWPGQEDAVRHAVSLGATWEEIAEALGVRVSTALRRHGPSR